MRPARLADWTSEILSLSISLSQGLRRIHNNICGSKQASYERCSAEAGAQRNWAQGGVGGDHTGSWQTNREVASARRYRPANNAAVNAKHQQQGPSWHGAAAWKNTDTSEVKSSRTFHLLRTIVTSQWEKHDTVCCQLPSTNQPQAQRSAMLQS